MNAKISTIGAAAILAGAQFLCSGAIAGGPEAMTRSSSMAEKNTNPSSGDHRMLPLAGVTMAEAKATLQKMALHNKLPFTDKDAEESMRQLSTDGVDCKRLGLLCPLVGKERVPGIIRATWQAELRTADFNETMAAFDSAVSSAAKQNGQSAKLEAKDKRQIQWIFGWPGDWNVIR